MADNEKYALYTERIKQPFSVKYRKVIRLGKNILMTAVFAAVVGVCFGLAVKATIGDVSKTQDFRTEVTIPQDVPTGSETPSGDSGKLKPIFEEPTDNPDVPQQPDYPNSAVEEKPFYATQYQDLSGLLEEINHSLVMVKTTSYHGDDYLTSIWQEVFGTGLFFADNGVEYLFLTQYEPCRGADSIEICFEDGYEVEAVVLSGSTVTDTAVIGVNISTIPFNVRRQLKMASVGNSYLVRQGQPLIARGTLYGLSDSMEYGMAVNTSNIIYDADGRFGMIYTNIASGAGNSGFLFNVDGEVIGVISDRDNSMGNVAAYGISDLKKILENMSNRKSIAYLGIIGYDISEDDAVKHGIPIGAYVTRTEVSSPAFFAGIQSGDIITKIGERTILNMYNVSMALCEYQPDSKVPVMVYRKGKDGYVPIEFTVTLSVK